MCAQSNWKPQRNKTQPMQHQQHNLTIAKVFTFKNRMVLMFCCFTFDSIIREWNKVQIKMALATKNG